MAVYTTIDDPSAHFQTTLFTGNGSTLAVTNGGNSDLQPDFVWIKNRDRSGYHHNLYDSSRGVLKQLYSNLDNDEHEQANSLTAFSSDGFSLGSDDSSNYNTENHVAWQWKANGGTTASNSDGSITSTVQANTTAGFSIVTYTGTGSNATIGHGLGAVPSFIILKEKDADDNWSVFHTSVGNTGKLRLNGTNATITASTIFNDTSPTSSVYTTGTDGELNGSMVAYCFTEIQGYSKFGIYTGNGDDDGAFIYTGFKPAWVMTKQNGGNNYWHIHDNKRNTFNPVGKELKANENFTESDPAGGENSRDFLSNGFKFRDADHNNQAQTYIYMAFAEQPFVTSGGVPCTAR